MSAREIACTIQVGEQADAFDQLVNVPQVAIRITKGHRNVDDDVQPGVVGLLLHLLQRFEIFFRRLVLIVLQECRRERVGEPESADGVGGDGTLGATLVDHDADDLDVIRRDRVR